MNLNCLKVGLLAAMKTFTRPHFQRKKKTKAIIRIMRKNAPRSDRPATDGRTKLSVEIAFIERFLTKLCLGFCFSSFLVLFPFLSIVLVIVNQFLIAISLLGDNYRLQEVMRSYRR